MTKSKYEGMQARAALVARQDNPYPGGGAERADWFSGYDLMDLHISEVLRNAREAVHWLEQARRDREQVLPLAS